MVHIEKLVLSITLCLATAALAQQPCKNRFSVVWKDQLGNIRQGLSAKDADWFQKKVAKKFPDVCYVSPTATPPLVLYITVSTGHYSGTRIDRHSETHSVPTSGTVRDATPGSDTYGQKIGEIEGETEVTTTSTQAVPVSYDYPILTLSVLQKTNGEWKGRHNFRRWGRKALFCIKGCGARRAVIEDAVKWIHSGGLVDPLQSVLPQEETK